VAQATSRLLRMQGLINGAQERKALDEVGASSARVRPDASLPPAEPVTLPEETEPPGP
jgi:hypothetical protein